MIGPPVRAGDALAHIGRFELVAELGHGAMGTVYRARDTVLDRPVALKTISPAVLERADTLARFQREARAAARLAHPGIVTIYELGEERGVHYIAMELLEGTDLARVPPGSLSFERRLRLVVETCRALGYAHAHGVVHRDVKPANIRLLPDGRVKVVDFGIARLGESSLTQAGTVLGTPLYMAPEVLTGTGCDHRADIWAAGVLLVELLTGRHPFEAPTLTALAHRVLQEPTPRLPSSVPRAAALDAVVARALARKPAERYRDMEEMARDLEAVEASLGSGVPDAPSGAVATREQPRPAAPPPTSPEPETLTRPRPRPGTPPPSAPVRAAMPAPAAVSRPPTPLPVAVPRPPTPPPTPAPVAPLPASPPSARGLPTPILDQLHVRGAAVFRELATFGEPPATRTATPSARGELLALGGADGAIRVWDLQARTRVALLRTDLHRRTGHEAAILSLVFRRDDVVLASGHVDGTVHLWDLREHAEIPARLRHDDMVGALAFSPDGATLASGSLDSTVKLWDLRAVFAGEARREMWRQPSGVTALAYGGGGTRLVTGHVKGFLRVHDARSGRLVATVRGPEGAVALLALGPDGIRLLVASQDRTVRLVDLASSTEVGILAGHRRPVSSIAFLGDGSHAAFTTHENAVHLWDLAARAAVTALWGGAEESFVATALCGLGDHLAAALADGRIRVWGPA